MTAPSHFAAQYIRMSTDKQDLSPLLQRRPLLRMPLHAEWKSLLRTKTRVVAESI